MAYLLKRKSLLIAALVLLCVIVPGGILLSNRLIQPSPLIGSPKPIPTNIDDAKIVGSQPQLIEGDNATSTTAISGIWESQVSNKKDRSQIIINNVSQGDFNFQLFIAEYKNIDEGERVSQGGFDRKAVFENGTTARFESLRGDAIKEASGTLRFNGEELTIAYDILIFIKMNIT